MKSQTEPKIGTKSYEFGKNGKYQLIIANSIEERTRAWALVYKSYLAKGYTDSNAEGLWYGIHDALPETTTFLVTREGQDVATLTLVMDSPLSIPADTLYQPEIDQMRTEDRHPAEIISLASTETDGRRCIEILRHMFRAAYLTARHLADATDLVVTVNPHHAGYYKKRLLFVQYGEEQSYDKVGGEPAVLLRLNFDTMDARYEERYGVEPGSVYDYYCLCDERKEIIKLIERNHQTLPLKVLTEYFFTRRPLLANAIPKVRDYICERYAISQARHILFPENSNMTACATQKVMIG